MPSRVAVILTCYNLGRTVEEAVESAVRQTHPPDELLIINDGSTDIYTLQVLARLGDRGHRIVDTPNAGVSAARNLGVRLTTAALVVFLDADDWLDPTYLEKAARRLGDEPDLSFVSCGMRCFGAADEVWFPPDPHLINSMTHGVVHISSMFRRKVWEAVGGFDESLAAHEEVDFWSSVLERGFRGSVLPEPLLHYRVSPGSMYQSAVRPNRHLRLMERLYRKRLAALVPHAKELLLEKERFILSQRSHQEHLSSRKSALEAELGGLKREIGETLSELQSLGARQNRVDLGELRRTTPISPVWGLDRGIPLDRHYIHAFLERCRQDIRGRVLEIKDSSYAHMFGDDRVTASDVLDVDADNEHATIIADLTRAEVIADNNYDCFILTQTLGVIYDVPAALRQAHRILKPGGVLLCTVPAAGRISYEEGLDNDFWRFTEASVRRLFGAVFSVPSFEVTGFGNVLSCSAFLYGLAPDELTRAELDTVDPFFPLVYGIRAVKASQRSSQEGIDTPVPVADSRGRSHALRPAGAILMYHRIAVDRPDRQGLCVSPENFRAQMQHLREEAYNVLPLPALARAAQRGDMRDRSIALTFDDGYLDLLFNAAPILADLSLPATLFAVGEALEGGYEFWWDTLGRVFLTASALPTRLVLELPGGPLNLPTDTPNERCAAHDRVADLLYTLTRQARAVAIRALLDWSGVPSHSDRLGRPMTPTELVRLAGTPSWTIGGHTESHVWLPTQPNPAKSSEVFDCKHRLDLLLGSPVTSFAYPYGGHDQETVEIVRQAGFEEAVTTEERLVVGGDDSLLLPRFEITDWDGETFADQLGRIFSAG